MEVSYKLLREFQDEHKSLPCNLTSEEFNVSFFPSVTAGPISPLDSGEWRTEYANDCGLRFSPDVSEIVVVALKVANDDGNSIHLLTSHSRVVQTVDFAPLLWDLEIAGHAVPYPHIYKFFATNVEYPFNTDKH